MLGDKSKLSSIMAILLAGSYSQQAFAEPYPDIDTMLTVIAPHAAINAPQLNGLIIAINALPTQQQRYLALQSLIPPADGSLRAASEGPMRQVLSVLNDRLIKVTEQTGVASGDTLIESPTVNVSSKEKASASAKKPTQTKSKVSAKVVIQQYPENKVEIVQVVGNQNKTVETDPIVDSKTEKNGKAEKTKAELSNGTTANTEKSVDAKQDTLKVETTEKTNGNGSTTQDTTVTLSNGTTDTSETPQIETTPVVVEKPKEILHGVWIQVLGDTIGQGVNGNIPGYDADVWGIVIGRDYLVCPFFAVGGALGYQHASVEQRNISGSFLDIQRFQATLYAGYKFPCPIYFNLAVTYAHNDYDNSRYILVPPVGGVPFVGIAHSDFNAEEFNAYIETGYTWCIGNFRAIPKAMLTYSIFDFKEYVEHDAFALDLYTRYHNMEFAPLGVGLKLEYQNEFEKAYVIPEIHAYYFHDFINDKQIASVLFTGGGFEFLNQGVSPGKDSIEVGAGIAVHSYQNTSVTIQYDYASRTTYHRHAAFIKVRHEWA